MAKVVLTFKVEEAIYSKLRKMAEKEGRGISEKRFDAHKLLSRYKK